MVEEDNGEQGRNKRCRLRGRYWEGEGCKGELEETE